MTTKFLDRNTLARLGLLECIQMCLDHASLEQLLDKRAILYHDLCFQFMSIFRARYRDGELVELTFKFQGRKYRLTPVQVYNPLCKFITLLESLGGLLLTGRRGLMIRFGLISGMLQS